MELPGQPPCPVTALNVMLMTYRRLASARDLLRAVAAQMVKSGAPAAACVNAVVAHSVVNAEDQWAQAMKIIVAQESTLFASLRYVQTVHAAVDMSFSVNRTAFGSKREALRNLVGGLRAAFDSEFSSPGQLVLVLEDDAVLAADAVNVFRAMETMMLEGRADFGTAHVEFRPSLIIGNRDITLVSQLRHTYDPLVVYEHFAAPRLVFTTRAWMVTNRILSQKLLPVLEAMAADDAPALRATAGLPPRAMHPALEGCTWCNDYCYDHAIEWIVQGKLVLAPAVSRATQVAGAGMSSLTGADNTVHSGPVVAQAEVVFAAAPHSWFIRVLFPGLGLSAIANSGAGGPLGVMDFPLLAASEPTVVFVLAVMAMVFAALLRRHLSWRARTGRREGGNMLAAAGIELRESRCCLRSRHTCTLLPTSTMSQADALAFDRIDKTPLLSQLSRAVDKEA